MISHVEVMQEGLHLWCSIPHRGILTEKIVNDIKHQLCS